jgi:chaperonin cofactor prefoldin
MCCDLFYNRQSQHEKLSTKLNEMKEKLDLAISTLQQAVGGINTHVDNDMKKVYIMLV